MKEVVVTYFKVSTTPVSSGRTDENHDEVQDRRPVHRELNEMGT
jgi:hypothetical protein